MDVDLHIFDFTLQARSDLLLGRLLRSNHRMSRISHRVFVLNCVLSATPGTRYSRTVWSFITWTESCHRK